VLRSFDCREMDGCLPGCLGLPDEGSEGNVSSEGESKGGEVAAPEEAMAVWKAASSASTGSSAAVVVAAGSSDEGCVVGGSVGSVVSVLGTSSFCSVSVSALASASAEASFVDDLGASSAGAALAPFAPAFFFFWSCATCYSSRQHSWLKDEFAVEPCVVS
jgi:hypothetical protein